MAGASQARWLLTPEALERLLQELGHEPEVSARAYETLRRKLIMFFDCRAAEASEDLADETLDRVARRLTEQEDVANVRTFLFGVAKNVWCEAEKRRAREHVALKDVPGRRSVAPEGTEERIEQLERCVEALPEDARALIVAYYQGAGRAHLAERKLLAQRLGVTYSTLKTRARRIRGRLEHCLRSRLAGGDG